MMKKIGQKHTVITLDTVLYHKAKSIQWAEPEKFQTTILYLGLLSHCNGDFQNHRNTIQILDMVQITFYLSVEPASSKSK